MDSAAILQAKSEEERARHAKRVKIKQNNLGSGVHGAFV
jgi:hypothetical protein